MEDDRPVLPYERPEVEIPPSWRSYWRPIAKLGLALVAMLAVVGLIWAVICVWYRIAYGAWPNSNWIGY